MFFSLFEAKFVDLNVLNACCMRQTVGMICIFWCSTYKLLNHEINTELWFVSFKLNALLVTSVAFWQTRTIMLYVVVTYRKMGGMHVRPVQEQPSGKTHIVLQSEQAWIVDGILWSADFKMSLLQVNTTREPLRKRCLCSVKQSTRFLITLSYYDDDVQD